MILILSLSVGIITQLFFSSGAFHASRHVTVKTRCLRHDAKKGAQLKRMRLWKPPHTGLSHDSDISICFFCLMSWCLSWRSLCAAALTGYIKLITACNTISCMFPLSTCNNRYCSFLSWDPCQKCLYIIYELCWTVTTRTNIHVNSCNLEIQYRISFNYTKWYRRYIMRLVILPTPLWTIWCTSCIADALAWKPSMLL
jgi:hypothetical protein